MPPPSYSLVCLVLCAGWCQGCSVSCVGGTRPCTDNIHGSVQSDCTGFLGCVNTTQPCAGECPPEYPVLSADGAECVACTEAGECPQCQAGERWCSAEGRCQPLSALCGGRCSVLVPVLDTVASECYPCPEGERWCGEEGRCYHPTTQPCNNQCQQWGTRYCHQSHTCVKDDIPCESLAAPQVKDLCREKSATVVKTQDGKSYTFSGELYYEEGTRGARAVSEGWPGLPGNIDAALTWTSLNDTYFFKGDKYWRFIGQTLASGYPKNLSNWSGFPSNMEAAKEWGRNEKFTYFFKSPNYFLLSTATGELSISQASGEGLDIGHWWFGCPHGVDWDVWMPVADLKK